jgi:flagellar protein FlbD
MIKLMKFNGEEFFLNPEHIKTVEAGGDTLITLVNGDKFLVCNSVEDINSLFINYKKEVHGVLPVTSQV